MHIYKTNTNIAKIKSYIGFAIRSNQVVWGGDKLLAVRNLPGLVLMDESLNAGMQRKLKEICARRGAVLIRTDILSELTNRELCKAIGIRERNLAKAILQYAEITEVDGE